MSRGLTLFDTPFLGSAGATDWASRVVSNGGALPSAPTIAAMETFRLGMISAGLDTKMHSLCIFVPDSIIAASTPLFKAKGSDPWTNHNFVTGDLTVAGLKGNSTDKYLDSGVNATSGQAVDAGTGNCGLSVIITETNADADVVDIGRRDTNLGGTTNPLWLATSNLATTYFDTKGVGAGNVLSFGDGIRSGFVSGNSVAGTCSVFAGSPQVAVTSIGSTAVTTAATASTNTIPCFALSTGVGAPTISNFSGKRMSMAAIHTGLTLAESITFYGLLTTLRTSLGGGTGDPGYAWGKRVELNGGSAPAAGNITACNTFMAALDAAGIANKMINVLPIAPDGLVACRVVLVGKYGNSIWTNVNFVGGDLTVNGLLGDESTKYLKSGVIGSSVTPLTSGSGGMSVMCSDATNQPAAAAIEMGAFDGSNQSWTVQRGATTTEFGDCWGAGGADRISGALPSATWPGFVTLNRTATNAMAMYRASTANAFATLASTAGAQTKTGRPTVEVYAYAQNTTGSPTFYSGHRLSFLALHTGLTSGEAQALYNAVAAMRTSFGGGNP